jgi:hypothetical protein
MIQQTNFATIALQRCQQEDSFLKELPLFEVERRMSNCSSSSNSSSSSLKRSRAVSGSFDMSEFLEASKKVEDSIAFPVIEWPSFDDDDDSSEDEDFCPPSKRQCKGLVRCTRSSNLSTLTETAERRGSNGSLA